MSDDKPTPDRLQSIEDEAYRQYRELRALGYASRTACLAVSLTERLDPSSFYCWSRTADRPVEYCRELAQNALDGDVLQFFYTKLAGIRRAMDEEGV